MLKETYNRVLLKRSRILVNNLGHFSKVEFNEIDKPSNTNEIDLSIEVEETSTGEFSLGGGYSSANGAQATIGLSEKTFLEKDKN